jgi:hypothetical protein
VKEMRERWKNSPYGAEDLLRLLDARVLTQTAEHLQGAVKPV